MLIRPYQDGDESAVCALWGTALPDASPHNEPIDAIRRKLVVDRDLFLVAVIDHVVVGTVMGGYDGHRGWVYSVAVDSSQRRKGVGTALVRHVEAALAERGCVKVNLQVRSSNAAVVEFYTQLGYAVEERISMGKRL